MIRTTASQATRSCRRRQNLKAYFSSSSIQCSDNPPPRKIDQEKFNYNPEIAFSADVSKEHLSYPLVTSHDLAKSCKTPPTRVRMLVRDYIEDALYNPHYGYFSKQATIFTAPGEENEGFNFNSFKDSAKFESAVAGRYMEYGDMMSGTDGPGRQIWHTPTELFKPWYGQAIARCLVSEYLLKYFPYEDFKIYEFGAGNGTLALNILDFLRANYPEVYDRTQYTIIEISAPLARTQRTRLRRAGHSQRTAPVEHCSVFAWTKTEHAPSFVLAAEVVDNFAHDVIRYDVRTLEPYQGFVAIDDAGEFIPYYTRINDALVASFLALRRRLKHQPALPWYLRNSALRRTYAYLPFAPNLSPPEYIPTRLLSLLRVLRARFPRHRLLLTDFSSLPDAVPGSNAPVVQTNVRGTMVPCQTIFVRQGYFDILFPTAFQQLRDMYEHVLEQPAVAIEGEGDLDELRHARISPLASTTSLLAFGSNFFSPSSRRSPLDGVASASGLPVGERKSSVFSHSEFLETYGDMGKTRLKNGENPLVAFYENVKFLF